ncbi:MAG: DUF4249 family protein [Bacteroidota bacterium]
MQQRKGTYLLGLLWLFCGLGCEKVIPFTPPTPPPTLIVNGLLHSDRPHQIHLDKLKAIGDSSISFVEGASVLLRSLTEGWESRLIEEDSGYYHSSGLRLRPGGIYQLRAQRIGYPTIIAMDTMPASPVFQIKDTSFFVQDGYSYLRIDLEMEDQEGADFYVVESFLREPNSVEDKFRLAYAAYELEAPTVGDEAGLDFDYQRLWLSDASWQGQKTRLSLDLDLYYFHDIAALRNAELIIQVSAVSQSYFRYLQTLTNYQNFYYSAALSFERQFQAVHSNVEGGYGILGCANAGQVVLRL